MLLNSKEFAVWQGELAMKLGSDLADVLKKMFTAKLAG